MYNIKNVTYLFFELKTTGTKLFVIPSDTEQNHGSTLSLSSAFPFLRTFESSLNSTLTKLHTLPLIKQGGSGKKRS